MKTNKIISISISRKLNGDCNIWIRRQSSKGKEYQIDYLKAEELYTSLMNDTEKVITKIHGLSVHSFGIRS